MLSCRAFGRQYKVTRNAAWRADEEDFGASGARGRAARRNRALRHVCFGGPTYPWPVAGRQPVQRCTPAPAPRDVVQPRSMDTAMADAPQQTKSKAGAPESQPWVRAPRAASLSLFALTCAPRLRSTGRARSTTWWRTKRLWTRVRASVRRRAQPSKPPSPQSRASQRRTGCRTCCSTARLARERPQRSWRLHARSMALRLAL